MTRVIRILINSCAVSIPCDRSNIVVRASDARCWRYPILTGAQEFFRIRIIPGGQILRDSQMGPKKTLSQLIGDRPVDLIELERAAEALRRAIARQGVDL